VDVKQSLRGVYLSLLAMVVTLALVSCRATTVLPTSKSDEVMTHMGACIGLRSDSPEASSDDCCARCVAEVSEVATQSSAYMSAALFWRQSLLWGMSLLGGLGCLGLVAFRSHRLRLEPHRSLAGGLLILAIAATVGCLAMGRLTREEGRQLVTADRTLRQLTRLGLIPRSNERSPVHCADLIEQLAPRSGSSCGTQLLSYRGAYVQFEKIDERSPQLKAEKEQRLRDAKYLINDKARLSPDESPTDADAVLRHNELLSEVADSWLWWLRYTWFDWLAIVVVGALLAWLAALLVSLARRHQHLGRLRAET
jgi:hypothetical protein